MKINADAAISKNTNRASAAAIVRDGGGQFLGSSTESTRPKGSLELVGEFFEVRTQVDRDLTIVSRVDRPLGLIKNLGCHSLPTLNGISSRDST
jgi:hypothetical protein